jgi:Hint domain
VRAEHLVNGATIARAESVAQVEYFHIELDSHDIVHADGAPAETYVDCDNRMMFSNGAEYALLHPADERPTWEFCAPRLEWGSEALTAIRAALSERAELLGHVLDGDPELRLIVDGEEIQPDSVTARRYLFQIPAGSGAVWLASRSAVPAKTVADSRDLRRLGVPIEHIVLCDGDLAIEAWHGYGLLCEGFHQDEASHRWTDGRARLPNALLRPFAGPATLEVHLTPSDLGYRPAPPARGDAAAA